MSSRKIQKNCPEKRLQTQRERKYPNNNHGNNNYPDGNKWIP
jgi:hypothetical protein